MEIPKLKMTAEHREQRAVLERAAEQLRMRAGRLCYEALRRRAGAGAVDNNASRAQAAQLERVDAALDAMRALVCAERVIAFYDSLFESEEDNATDEQPTRARSAGL